MLTGALIWLGVGFASAVVFRAAGEIGQPRWWPYLFLTLLGPVSVPVALSSAWEYPAKKARRAYLKRTEDENYQRLKEITKC